MTQPKYAPILQSDEVRPSSHLAAPRAWTPHRPGEFRPGALQSGRGIGTAGPDQGYALHLAASFTDALVLERGEHVEDALAGAVAIATRRASLFGRAPVAADIELGLALFGYLAAAPPRLVEHRRALFDGASHDYWEQRELAHAIPTASLRLTPAVVRAEPDRWAEFLGITT